ncbi:hypothetical protein VSR69_08415 [Paraburkholderia phytofirmans]|nr:hypothetical protein [Paraburkholderia sp. BL9I2N2]
MSALKAIPSREQMDALIASPRACKHATIQARIGGPTLIATMSVSQSA